MPAPDEPALGSTAEGTARPSSSGAPLARSCRLVLELLPEAVGGDLDAGTELAIARHVSGCHSCGREWASLRRAHRALTSLSQRDAGIGEGGEGSPLDDAFFAELHQDIIGEVRYRDQVEKDQQLFASARPVPDSPQPLSGAVRSIRGIRSHVRASLLHVASLAAAVVLGILIGKQFDGGLVNGGLGVPEANHAGESAIRVESEVDGGRIRHAGDANLPRVKRLDMPETDADFRAWLDRWLEDLYLPQPVTPGPVILTPPTDGSGKGASTKKGEDF